MTQVRRIIGAREAADILGKSPRQIIRDAERGYIIGEKLPGRTGAWTFSLKHIESLALAGRR